MCKNYTNVTRGGIWYVDVLRCVDSFGVFVKRMRNFLLAFGFHWVKILSAQIYSNIQQSYWPSQNVTFELIYWAMRKYRTETNRSFLIRWTSVIHYCVALKTAGKNPLQKCRFINVWLGNTTILLADQQVELYLTFQ